MSARLSREHVALGAAIRELRLEKGLSQEALGHASGLHRNHIGGIERGELNPSYTSILRLAAALDLRASAVIALAESRPKRRRQ